MPRQESPRPLAQQRVSVQVVQRLRSDLAPGRENRAPLCSFPAAIIVEGHHGLEDTLRFVSGLVSGVLVLEGDRHPLQPRKGCRLAYRSSAFASSIPKAAGWVQVVRMLIALPSSADFRIEVSTSIVCSDRSSEQR